MSFPTPPDGAAHPPTRTKGPVTLRRSQVPQTTTDQRLLDSPGESDWVHTDPWRVLRIQAEFVEGFGALAGLGAAVSIFGSARTKPEDPAYQQAHDVAATRQTLDMVASIAGHRPPAVARRGLA